jgi:hypothetical protein
MGYVAASLVFVHGLISFALLWLAKDISWLRVSNFTGFAIMDKPYTVRRPLIPLHIMSIVVISLLLLDSAGAFALAAIIWLISWGFWLDCFAKLWPLSGEKKLSRTVTASLLLTCPVVTLLGGITAIHA